MGYAVPAVALDVGRRGSWRRMVGVVGEVLLTLGVVVLLFVAYELWFTGLYTAGQQARLGDALRRQWASAPVVAGPGGPGSAMITAAAASNPVPGSAVGIIRIPRLGADYAKVIVEGVGHEDLKKGPGHYPGTALPGQVGNTVISGHRTTYGEPFNQVDELRAGDAIVVETRADWFVYRVTGEQVVSPTAVEVTYPVPGRAGAVPTQRLLTLTTCNPKYSASQRLIVRGVLARTVPKSGGREPAGLTAVTA